MATVAPTQKLVTTVPVRKPARDWFFQTHPDPAYRLPTHIIEIKDDNEYYLVERTLWDSLGGESMFVPKILIPAINKQNMVFIWPIRLTGSDGRLDGYNASALEAADMAKTKWLRLQSNRGLGAYEIYEAKIQSIPPVWPDLPFRKMIDIAFKGKVIGSLEHPVLKRLRGES